MRLLTLGLLFISCCSTFAQSPKLKLILDADTGNEVDDLYAITRALIEPGWELTALNATHWQTAHWAIEQTMENSHRLNQVLVGYIGVPVKTRRGAIARMFDWGDQAQHSAAAYEIIQQAEALAEGEKLTVVALGALTNVASAIFIRPEIARKIRLYWLGTSYDFEKDILGRTDFNCAMDIQAIDLLLKSEAEMHVIPVNIAAKMTVTYAELDAALRGKHGLGDFLVDRWYQHLDGSRKERVLWDLALIEAMIHPEMATVTEVQTSRDSGNRKIYYYSDIDAEKMKADFLETLLAWW